MAILELISTHTDTHMYMHTHHCALAPHNCLALLQFIGAVVESTCDPMIVMEYMELGALYSILHNETTELDGDVRYELVCCTHRQWARTVSLHRGCFVPCLCTTTHCSTHPRTLSNTCL